MEKRYDEVIPLLMIRKKRTIGDQYPKLMCTSSRGTFLEIRPWWSIQSMFSCQQASDWDRNGVSFVSIMGRSVSMLLRSTVSERGKFSSFWCARRVLRAASGSFFISEKPLAEALKKARKVSISLVMVSSLARKMAS